MTFKKIIGFIHLWLGLTSGLVVFIVAITGAFWAFESEISDMIYSYRTVEPQNKAYLLPSKLKEIAQPHFGDKQIKNINFLGKDRAAELSMYEEVNGKDNHISVFMNPYTGEVLHIAKNEHNFFGIIIELHVNLMLGEVGGYIVDYATLIFLIMLISGIILWWPKNKAAAKQRFWFKWKQGLKWKRKNYDLHNILGFYASWVVIFIALTGLAWGFTWMDRTIYFVASGGEEYKEWEEVKIKSDSTLVNYTNIEDKVYADVIKRYGKSYESIYMYAPEKKSDSYYAYINPSSKTWYKAETFYYDTKTADLLKYENPNDLNGGQTVRNMFYDIHIGKILGLPGQFLVFFASLIVASLPITGFYIWYGRRKKTTVKKNEEINIPATTVAVD
jgi:uncharacterized iron-regulated membrane protein